jgi:hypothetical protein
MCLPHRSNCSETRTQSVRRAQEPTSGVRTLARSITIVTSISSDGILRQHATGKSSRANRVWETSMQFKNQLPGGPSLRMFVTSEDGEAISPALPVAYTGTTRAGQSRASRWRLRSHLEVVDRAETDDRLGSRDAASQTSSGRDASRCSILARRSLAGIKAIGGFAARGKASFASVLLAAMSWTIAQILEGCAEYCQAMYPTFVEPDEPVGRHYATSGPHPARELPINFRARRLERGGR